MENEEKLFRKCLLFSYLFYLGLFLAFYFLVPIPEIEVLKEKVVAISLFKERSKELSPPEQPKEVREVQVKESGPLVVKEEVTKEEKEIERKEVILLPSRPQPAREPTWGEIPAPPIREPEIDKVPEKEALLMVSTTKIERGEIKAVALPQLEVGTRLVTEGQPDYPLPVISTRDKSPRGEVAVQPGLPGLEVAETPGQVGIVTGEDKPGLPLVSPESRGDRGTGRPSATPGAIPDLSLPSGTGLPTGSGKGEEGPLLTLLGRAKRGEPVSPEALQIGIAEVGPTVLGQAVKSILPELIDFLYRAPATSFSEVLNLFLEGTSNSLQRQFETKEGTALFLQYKPEEKELKIFLVFRDNSAVLLIDSGLREQSDCLLQGAVEMDRERVAQILGQWVAPEEAKIQQFYRVLLTWYLTEVKGGR